MDTYRPFKRGTGQKRQKAAVCKERLDNIVLAAQDDTAESIWIGMKGKANKLDIVVAVYY